MDVPARPAGAGRGVPSVVILSFRESHHPVSLLPCRPAGLLAC